MTYSEEHQDWYKDQTASGSLESADGSGHQGKEFKVHVQANTAEEVIELLEYFEEVAKLSGLENTRVLSANEDPDGGFEANYAAHNPNPISWIKSKVSDFREKRSGEQSSEEPEFFEPTSERFYSDFQYAPSEGFSTKAEQELWDQNYLSNIAMIKAGMATTLGADGKPTEKTLSPQEQTLIEHQAAKLATDRVSLFTEEVGHVEAGIKSGVPKYSVEYQKVWNKELGKHELMPVYKELSPLGQRMEAAKGAVFLKEADLMLGHKLPLDQDHITASRESLAEQTRMRRETYPIRKEIATGELELAKRQLDQEAFRTSSVGKGFGAVKAGAQALAKAPGLGHGMAIMAATQAMGRPTSTYTGSFYKSRKDVHTPASRAILASPQHVPAAQAILPSSRTLAGRTHATTANPAGAAMKPSLGYLGEAVLPGVGSNRAFKTSRYRLFGRARKSEPEAR